MRKKNRTDSFTEKIAIDIFLFSRTNFVQHELCVFVSNFKIVYNLGYFEIKSIKIIK
jgi:hypothetical protein